MAKFKNNNKKSKTLVLIAKNITKKGKIKGSNKKETKQLKLMCPHHRITKKGAVKSTLIPGGVNEEGKQVCVCELCKKEVATKFFTDEQVNEIIGNMDALLQQEKYIGTAIGANKVTDFAAQACVMVNHAKKSYIRSRNIAKKSGNIKKKKKDSGRGSNVYGSWAVQKK